MEHMEVSTLLHTCLYFLPTSLSFTPMKTYTVNLILLLYSSRSDIFRLLHASSPPFFPA